MIDLLPQAVEVFGFESGNRKYIELDSLLHVFTQMQLTNAKNARGKKEYDEVLSFLKEHLSKAKFA